MIRGHVFRLKRRGGLTPSNGPRPNTVSPGGRWTGSPPSTGTRSKPDIGSAERTEAAAPRWRNVEGNRAAPRFDSSKGFRLKAASRTVEGNQTEQQHRHNFSSATPFKTSGSERSVRTGSLTSLTELRPESL